MDDRGAPALDQDRNAILAELERRERLGAGSAEEHAADR
jgi:hypothetical protein